MDWNAINNDMGYIWKVPPKESAGHYAAWNIQNEQVCRIGNYCALAQPKMILELGTFEGRTALFLAELLPDSTIVTIDNGIFGSAHETLPDPDAEFSRIREIRARRVNSRPNIRYVETFSYDFLMGNTEMFDLILHDATHTVTSIQQDLPLMVKALNSGGMLLIDDIKEFHTDTQDFREILFHEELEEVNCIDNMVWFVKK